eukprot:scaffold94848_cov65-Phaeocystis_antarctica.AAC.11
MVSRRKLRSDSRSNCCAEVSNLSLSPRTMVRPRLTTTRGARRRVSAGRCTTSAFEEVQATTTTSSTRIRIVLFVGVRGEFGTGSKRPTAGIH